MRLRFVKPYLVREDDGLTLVDTMLKGSGKGLLPAAADLGAPIARVVLTHAHVDHVGSVDELVATLPDAELSFSRRDARSFEGDEASTPTSRARSSAALPEGLGAAGSPARARRPGSARSRFTPRPATGRATSRSATPAIGR